MNLKNKLSLFLMVIIPWLSIGQPTLITSGITSGGGHAESNIEFNYAVGQMFSTPIESSELKGSEGVIQSLYQETTNTSQILLEGITIHPTITNQYIYISASTSEPYDITVVDIMGRKLLETMSENKTYEINLESILPGSYFILLQQNAKQRIFKIVKI